MEAFEVIYQALSYMQKGGNGEFKDSSSDAQTYFRTIKHSEFLVSLVVTTNVFDQTLALTIQLQQRRMDSR